MSHKLFKFQNIQLRPTRQNTNIAVQGTQEQQFEEIVRQAQESAIRRLQEEEKTGESTVIGSICAVGDRELFVSK